jgi:hypothetical protein
LRGNRVKMFFFGPFFSSVRSHFCRAVRCGVLACAGPFGCGWRAPVFRTYALDTGRQPVQFPAEKGVNSRWKNWGLT